MLKRTKSRERFPIGEWARKAKNKRIEAVEASKSLEKIEQEILSAKETTKILKENNVQLQGEIKELRRKRGFLEDEKVHLPRGSAVPTKLDKENSDCTVGLSEKIASKRRKRTVDAAKMIHSCPQTPDEISKTDALNGLWNTFVSYGDNKEVTMLCSRSRKVNTLVVPKVVNNAVAAFEKSAKNYERSVSVIYRGGILSKRKYNELRSSEMFEFDLPTGKRRRTEFKKGCKVPSLVSYKKLMKFISQQEIGTLHNIPQARADSEIEKESEDVNQNLLPLVPGHFIDLEERLLQMADLYLHIDSHRPNFLNWFGKEKGNFLVAIGADGAPFGKCNEACSWLVSFLNVTERVSSPYDNFLICGGNCVEDHPSMIEYGKLLRSQISDLEKKTFTVKGLQVNFTFKLVPSDMKWLSKFSGELSNAATYPNPFANVNQKDLSERGCTLGNGPRDKWKPWAYDFRMQVANKVAQFKQKQPKPTNASQMQTLRNKVCQFIGNLKSRQEYEPILGPLVQNAKADSLHLGNNCWGHWLKKVLTTILANAKVGTNVKSVFQLPEDNPLRKHLKTLRFKLKCKKLYNKFCRWFKEKRKIW